MGIFTAAATAVGGLIPLLVTSTHAYAAAPPLSSYQAPGTPSPSVAGATTPFTTYQAPEGQLGGGASVVSLTASPTSQYDTPQGEAAGHAYVQLTGNGQYVQWTNNTGQPINFINVRASMPDSSSGGGMTSTLDLYVNGAFRQAINLNSIQSWQYEGNNNYRGEQQLQRQRPEPGGRRPTRLLGRVPRVRRRQPDPGGRDVLATEGLCELGVVLLGELDRPMERPGARRAAGELDLDHQLRGDGGQHADQRPGTGVQLWSNGGGTNQQWRPVQGSNGYYTFQARNSGLCLTVPNSSTANGVQLVIEPCNGSTAQAFQLVQQP